MQLKLVQTVTGVCLILSVLQGCKTKTATDDGAPSESEVAFAPVAVGAAYGVNVSLQAAAAVTAAYAIDCARPVAAGEIRFFCDGGMRLGQSAVQMVVNSVNSLAGALQWSQANLLAHLSMLAGLNSNTHLKAALVGTSKDAGVANARVSPQIASESGRRNLLYGLKESIRIEDKTKRSCDYVAQYEARLVPREYKGNWMSGTSVRFMARAASPVSAEAMALFLCEEYATVHFKLAPGAAGLPRSLNDCRKPKSLAGYKEKYKTEDISCPGAKVCTSESDCVEYKL